MVCNGLVKCNTIKYEYELKMKTWHQKISFSCQPVPSHDYTDELLEWSIVYVVGEHTRITFLTCLSC
jgi:hypothetical protein